MIPALLFMKTIFSFLFLAVLSAQAQGQMKITPIASGDAVIVASVEASPLIGICDLQDAVKSLPQTYVDVSVNEGKFPSNADIVKTVYFLEIPQNFQTKEELLSWLDGQGYKTLGSSADYYVGRAISKLVKEWGHGFTNQLGKNFVTIYTLDGGQLFDKACKKKGNLVYTEVGTMEKTIYIGNDYCELNTRVPFEEPSERSVHLVAVQKK